MKKVAALLLAAGKSSRAQRFKPLAPWRGETFVEKVYHSLAKTGALSEILVVTGFQHEVLNESLGRLGARSVFNPKFSTGMQSSIQIGLSSLKPGWDAALIALVDQPQLETTHYARLISCYQTGEAELLRPVYQGRMGNPAIIGSCFLEEVLKAPEMDSGCAYLFLAHAEQTAIVEMPDGLCLMDYDQKSDFEEE